MKRMSLQSYSHVSDYNEYLESQHLLLPQRNNQCPSLLWTALLGTEEAHNNTPLKRSAHDKNQPAIFPATKRS